MSRGMGYDGRWESRVRLHCGLLESLSSLTVRIVIPPTTLFCYGFYLENTALTAANRRARMVEAASVHWRCEERSFCRHGPVRRCPASLRPKRVSPIQRLVHRFGNRYYENLNGHEEVPGVLLVVQTFASP